MSAFDRAAFRRAYGEGYAEYATRHRDTPLPTLTTLKAELCASSKIGPDGYAQDEEREGRRAGEIVALDDLMEARLKAQGNECSCQENQLYGTCGH